MKRESMGRLLLGLGTGMVYGFLLQKGRVARHRAIVEQVRLRDFTVAKTMATATAVGAVGVQMLREIGKMDQKVKPLNLIGTTLGGVLFGSGMALLGYCPGTSVAAVGAGNRDALVGVAGMLGGATAWVKLYPRLAPVLARGNLGELTLPGLARTSPWIWVAGTAAAAAAGAAALEKRERALLHSRARQAV
jgi:uncharacterized membrane protein YedE/YeeE